MSMGVGEGIELSATAWTLLKTNHLNTKKMKQHPSVSQNLATPLCLSKLNALLNHHTKFFQNNQQFSRPSPPYELPMPYIDVVDTSGAGVSLLGGSPGGAIFPVQMRQLRSKRWIRCSSVVSRSKVLDPVLLSGRPFSSLSSVVALTEF